jgi:hypothetical protein
MREEMRNAYSSLLGKFEWKRLSNRWKDNIKMNLADGD